MKPGHVKQGDKQERKKKDTIHENQDPDPNGNGRNNNKRKLIDKTEAGQTRKMRHGQENKKKKKTGEL